MRAIHPRWRWWSVRAIVLFGGVLGLGAAGVPTLIPYLAALVTVAIDAVRVYRSAT